MKVLKHIEIVKISVIKVLFILAVLRGARGFVKVCANEVYYINIPLNNNNRNVV